MKNYSEYREERLAPRVPRSGGHDPFRFRKPVTDHGQKMRAQKEWRRSEPEEYRLASLRKLILGRLPRRAAKYGCADFDLEDMSEYEGDDGTAMKGHDLAGIAAHIVRCAKHPVDYLFSLRNVPAKVLEPMKAYLRVKLAMGRLRDEIEANASYSSNIFCSAEVPAQGRDDSIFCDRNIIVIPEFASQISGTSRGQNDVEGAEYLNASISSIPRRSCGVPAYAVCEQTAHRDDSNIIPPDKGIKPPPTFKWHISPAKVHDFKALTQTCGYDPRETSVYWIEKRANALRRKWKKHGAKMRGETLRRKPKASIELTPDTPENAAPKIKYFAPKDIDYNSVWPPVKMPDGPPKMVDAARESITETLLDSMPRNDFVENGSATPEQDICSGEVPACTVCDQTAQRDDRVYCDNDRTVMTGFADCGQNPALCTLIKPETNPVHERAPP